MKEFDLQAAKKGAPTMTRDGHKARIVCFDLKDPVRPLLVLIEEREVVETGLVKSVTEIAVRYAANGKCDPNHPERDLMLNTTKHTGFVNIFKEPAGERISIGIFKSKSAAEENDHKFGVPAIATVEIEWEE